jgi:hypothetical protein
MQHRLIQKHPEIRADQNRLTAEPDGDLRLYLVRAVPAPGRKIGSVRIMLSSWEPPIGIEPMTYALRVRRSNRLS